MRRVVPVVVPPGLALAARLRAQGATLDVTGVVFLDRDGNGIRDRGEAGIPNVVVSDQIQVVRTGAEGSFRISASSGWGMIFVSVPDGYRSVGPFWRETRFAAANTPIEFALAPAPTPAAVLFLHACGPP